MVYKGLNLIERGGWLPLSSYCSCCSGLSLGRILTFPGLTGHEIKTFFMSWCQTNANYDDYMFIVVTMIMKLT